MNYWYLLNNFREVVSSPDGMELLRIFILNLAFDGKLSKQDKDEESGKELANRIRERIKELQIAGEFPPQEILPELNPEEIPYDIPDNWHWFQFGELLDIQGGGQPPKSQFSSEPKDDYIRLIQIRDLGSNPLPVFVPKNKVSKFCVDGDILIGRYGASVGKVFWAFEGAYNVALVKVIFIKNLLHSPFLFYLLKSEIFQNHLANSNRSAQGGFNKGDIYPIILPLPPLQEQKRIVTKIEELMALCDQLEVKQNKQGELRQKVNQSLVSHLTNSETIKELESSWIKYSTNMPSLLNTEDSVESLKEAIIRLGVEGKLAVPTKEKKGVQDLLNKLDAEYQEKRQSGLADRRRKPKKILVDEINFTTPAHWQIIRLGQLILSSEAGWSPQCEVYPRDDESEWGVLKISAVTWDKFLPNENKLFPIDGEPRQNIEVKNGDFLITRANTLELVAKSVVVESTPPKLMMSDKIIRLNFISLVDKRFYNLFNNSILGREYYSHHATGTSSSMRNVSRQTILNMPVPLPPLNEQKAIVEKVEYLLALCESLGKTINKRESTQAKFSVAAIRELLDLNGGSQLNPVGMGKPQDTKLQRNLVVLIKVAQAMNDDIDTTVLASILKSNGGQMEAKELWKASKLKAIDDFYAQLKQEIEAGFIQEPDIAELNLVEIVE